MITPILEKAILSGLATYANYPIGGAPVLRIPVPEDHIAFLVDFTYYPYSKSGNWYTDASQGNILLNDQNVFQEVDFYSGNLAKKWVFKTQIQLWQGDAGNHLYQYAPGEFKVDTLCEFTKDIYVEFKTPQVGNSTGSDTGVLLNNQDPGTYNGNTGEGFGNVLPAVKAIFYASGRRYYPAGIDNGTIAPANRFDYETITGLNDLGNPVEMYDGNANGPSGYNINSASVNVGLVFINKQYRAELFK